MSLSMAGHALLFFLFNTAIGILKYLLSHNLSDSYGAPGLSLPEVWTLHMLILSLTFLTSWPTFTGEQLQTQSH